MNPSPLRYPGGKYKLYKYISELVKENNCTTYIEPFCGGAAIAIELLLDNVVKNIVINDYDYTIYCFWHSVLYKTDEFIERIEKIDVSIDEWHKQKAIREEWDNYSSLDIGLSTFFLNRTNHSGIIDKAGPIGGFSQQGNYLIDCRFNKKRLIEQIKKIGDKRDHIRLYNLEALDFIDDVILQSRRAFVFFDPPYYGKGPDLYTNFYSHGDHANLAKTILKKMKKRKWIVTYDNTSAIKSMYARVDHIEFELKYSLQNKRLGSEAMFFSKQIRRPVQEKKYINITTSEAVQDAGNFTTNKSEQVG